MKPEKEGRTQRTVADYSILSPKNPDYSRAQSKSLISIYRTFHAEFRTSFNLFLIKKLKFLKKRLIFWISKFTRRSNFFVGFEVFFFQILWLFFNCFSQKMLTFFGIIWQIMGIGWFWTLKIYSRIDFCYGVASIFKSYGCFPQKVKTFIIIWWIMGIG